MLQLYQMLGSVTRLYTLVGLIVLSANLVVLLWDLIYAKTCAELLHSHDAAEARPLLAANGTTTRQQRADSGTGVRRSNSAP